ncbi:hypothetical protein TI04_03245 [Achromatium sp. WMS2]|nr:hypothetical protein TI04_03245 [Achromatium sp. WMS2]
MPYLRLAALYFCYFAALGAVFPFWGLYLKQKHGVSPLDIGELMAILMATKTVAPNLWTAFTSNYDPITQVRIAAFLNWISFLGIFWAQNFWQLALVIGLFGCFWHAVLPQIEVITLSYLQDQANNYSLIRLWGSIGFIVTVMVLSQASVNYGLQIVPITILTLYVGLWIVSLSIPKRQFNTSDAVEIKLNDNILARNMLLVICFLMQVSHGAYYAFYSIYLEQYHYTNSIIGIFWILGVSAEIGIFLSMGRIMKYYGARNVVLISLGAAVLRWLLIGLLPEYFGILVMAQVLHALTFGAFHAAAIHLVHRYFVGTEQSFGQALYSGVSFGAGGAVGSLISGNLWVTYGATITFIAAASIAWAGMLLAWWYLESDKIKYYNYI